MQPVWQSRTGPRGTIEFWRRGPGGSTLSVHQPHGADGYWRMYWRNSPVVRHHLDPGIFDTSLEAVMALDRLAADDMRTALLD